VSGAPRLARPFRAGSGAPADLIAVRPTDATFAVPGERGEVELLDAGTLTRTARIALPAGADSLRAIAASPDGRTLAVATSGGAVAFADVPTGRLRAPPSAAHAGAVLGLAYSPDARWLASSGEDGSIYVWDARRAKPVRLFVDLSGDATSLSVSPDGSKLAATVVHPDGTGEVDILRMPRPALVSRSPALVGTQSQFSRDGRLLFYADRTGRVWTLDTRTWAPQGPPLGVPGDAGRFALSPDDRVIAITRGDGRTQLWDVASRRPIGAALPGVAGPETRAAFVDGGHALVTLGRGGRGYVWDVDPRSWARRACAVAGRTLTRAEWRAALPGRDYAPACRRG
jgi:WD40 repeat protein